MSFQPDSQPTANRTRSISLNNLRAFDAVARHLNFRQAAEELSLTQSAVSRQIQALEQVVGVKLFLRHTRAVELTSAGGLLQKSVASSLQRVDTAVRQIRYNSGRQSVSISTWASFASLWLIPRLEAFQRDHPDIDIRIDATDAFVDLGTADVDLALRYAPLSSVPTGAVRLFGEQLTAVASPWLLKSQPIHQISDLAHCTLIEDSDVNLSRDPDWLSWPHWLKAFGASTDKPQLQPDGKLQWQPKRWLYFNYTHQIAQAALTGQGVALARLPLVAESLASADLMEVLPGKRLKSPQAYWLLMGPRSHKRPEVRAFCEWLCQQAQSTRQAIGEVSDQPTLSWPD